MKEVIHKILSYKINGLLFKTHNNLGRYKNEKQYGDYFEFLLQKENINYKREMVLNISFEGERKGRNICDFIVDDKIIIELKAVKFISNEHYFQIKRYLSSSNLKLGILVNFRQKFLSIKRIINNKI